jgi:class 3 adenylate cyclase
MRSAGEAAIRSRPGPGPHEPATRLLESFKIHLAVYLPVNLFLIGIWAAGGGGYFWPIWAILGWGIMVACHAAPLLARVGSRASPAPGQRYAWSGVAPEGTTSVDDVAAPRGQERPSLRSAAAPDGTVTILFSDIEGSTLMNERLGDVRWLELLRAHHVVVRDQLHEHGGYEVKAQGDGFMIAFASARCAVQCARAIQRAIDARLGEHPDGPIRLRIGLHTGEAIRDEADFYGKNVVLAARITDQARGGEVLVSSVVKQLTDSAGDVHFDDERQLELDGLAGTHTVYRVM